MSNSNITSHRHEYTIVYSNDEEGYSGRCIELPAAISQGQTLDELRENMREAIELVIESTREEAEKQKNSNKMTIEVSI